MLENIRSSREGLPHVQGVSSVQRQGSHVQGSHWQWGLSQDICSMNALGSLYIL